MSSQREDRDAVIVFVLLGIGLMLILAGPTLVELWFMPQRLEILRMGIEAAR